MIEKVESVADLRDGVVITGRQSRREMMNRWVWFMHGGSGVLLLLYIVIAFNNRSKRKTKKKVSRI